MKSTNTRSVLTMLREFSDVFGLPLRIVTDRGTAYTSRAFADYCAENDIQHIKNAVRTPRANGHIERVNGTIVTFLQATTENCRKWDAKLRELQWAINSQINKTSNCSPNDVVLRFKPRDMLQNRVMAVLSQTDETVPDVPTPEEIAAHIDRQKATWKERYDKRHRAPSTYAAGDLVLVENCPTATGESRKLEPKYRWPYVVAQVLGRDRYLIRDLDDIQRNQRPFESVFSSDNMKRWCTLGPEDREIVDDNDTDDQDQELPAEQPGVEAIPSPGLAEL